MDYHISFHNKKIFDFYQEHKNIDIESMNLVLIDILDKLYQDINPVLTSNLASQLIENMKNLQTQMNSMNDSFTKSQSELNTNFVVKFMEFKKDYIEDLKMILTNTTSEKIAPIIKQYNDSLLDKTQLMISDLIPKNNNLLSQEITTSMKDLHSTINIDTINLLKNSVNKESLEKFISSLDEKFTQTVINSQTIMNSLITSSEQRLDTRITDIRTVTEQKFSEMKEISTLNNGSQNQLQTNISDLLKKMENSSSKGKISENILYNIITPLYPSAEINSVGTTKETGDIMMYRKDKPTILLENKNYDKNVTTDEVKKFIRDIETQNCCGIMLAQHSGIANKENYQIELYKKNIVVYLHNVDYDSDKIKVAIDIIDHFKSQITDIDTGSDVLTIEKHILDDINSEYQLFMSQKLTHIKTIKEFNQKLLSQVDEINIPSLEQFLYKNYSISTSTSQDVCEFCSRSFKSQRALSAHYRGCIKKNDSKTNPLIENIVFKS
jgi:hypothetical protein